MARIKRTLVASGVIGQYDHEWQVMMQYDSEYGSECYDLFVNKEFIDSFSSVVNALAELVEQFAEQ